MRLHSLGLGALFAAALVLSPGALDAASTPSAAERYAAPADRAVDIGDYIPIPATDCKTDADCKDPNPDDCKGYKCVPYKSEVNPFGPPTVVGKCTEYNVPNCLPPPVRDCNKLHDGEPFAVKCCEIGFDQSTDPAKFKCCSEHVSHSEDPGTPDNPVPCDDCPKCPPPPPPLKCEDIVDLKSRECCLKNGSIPLLVIDNCYDSAEKCKNELTIIVGGDFTNTGCIQQCCDIKAGGDVSACNCLLGCPPGTPTTGTPITPAALGACRVDPEISDTADGKQFALDSSGKGVAWIVSYTPSSAASSIASVTLAQKSGPQLTVDGEPEDSAAGTEVTALKALSTKSIAGPSALSPFRVFTPSVKGDMRGDFAPKFMVEIQVKDLGGGTLETLTCGNEAFIHAQGSGCGCSLSASPRDLAANAAFLLLLIASPWLGLRLRFLAVRGRSNRT